MLSSAESKARASNTQNGSFCGGTERKGFGSHPLPILSSALPQCTAHRWDITFEGNQELAGFNMAALVGILLGGKAIVSESITASVS